MSRRDCKTKDTSQLLCQNNFLTARRGACDPASAYSTLEFVQDERFELSKECAY